VVFHLHRIPRISAASGPQRLFGGGAYCPKCGAYSRKYGSRVFGISLTSKVLFIVSKIRKGWHYLVDGPEQEKAEISETSQANFGIYNYTVRSYASSGAKRVDV